MIFSLNDNMHMKGGFELMKGNEIPTLSDYIIW